MSRNESEVREISIKQGGTEGLESPPDAHSNRGRLARRPCQGSAPGSRRLNKPRPSLQKFKSREEELASGSLEPACARVKEADVSRTPSPIEHSEGSFSDAFKTLVSQKEAMEGAIERCKLDLMARDIEVSELKQEKEALSPTIHKWKTAVEQLRVELRETRIKADATASAGNQALRHAEAENQNLRAQLAKLQQEQSSLKRQIGQRDDRLRDAHRLLDTRGKELKMAQTFLVTADQYAVADVSKMVNQLNEAIFQLATKISDAVVQQSSKGTVENDMRTMGYKAKTSEALEKQWGATILTRLREDTEQGDTLLFESLIQNMLIVRCYEIIRSFSLENRDFDNRCTAMWGGILRAHDTPIARKWLSMTHSQLKSESIFNGDVLDGISEYMAVAGWTFETDKSIDVEARVQTALKDMTERALEIKKAVTQGILSVEVEVFYFGRGILFDSANMQDTCEVPGSAMRMRSKPEEIICSTELGVRSKNRNGYLRHSGVCESGKGVVLKPKVLLPSALESSDK